MRKTIPLTWLVLALTLGAGCSDKPLVVETENILSIPDSFESGGHRWTLRETLDSQAEDCLQKFFATHADFATSPEFENDPAVFNGKNSDLRFYWLSSAASECLWVCVRFENGRYEVEDGTGSPFL